MNLDMVVTLFELWTDADYDPRSKVINAANKTTPAIAMQSIVAFTQNPR